MCENRLVDQICKFLDDLMNVIPEDNDIKMFRVFLETIDHKLVFDNFQQFVYPHKKQIEERNEAFFLENDYLFGPIAAQYFTKFKYVWVDLTPEDKDSIWKWFKSFTNICMLNEKKRV